MTAELLQVLATAVNQLHQCCRENLSYEGQVALKGTVTLSTDITATVAFYTNAENLIVQRQEPNLELPENTQQIPEENICNIENTFRLKEEEQGTSNYTRESLKERESAHTQSEPVKGFSIQAEVTKETLSVINKTGRGRKRKIIHVDSKDVPSEALHQTPIMKPLVVTSEISVPSRSLGKTGSGPVVIHSAQVALESHLVESTNKGIKTQTRKRQTSCHVCGIDFTFREDLLKHRDAQHSVLATTDAGTTERRYPCDLCRKYFNTFWRMVDHWRNHEDKYRCSYCSDVFTRENALKKHIAFKHEGQGQEPNLELLESTQHIPEENVCNVKNTASLKEVEQGTSNSTRDSLKERESTHTKLEPVKGCSTEAEVTKETLSVINKTGRGRKRKIIHVNSKDVPSKALHQTPIEKPLVVTSETSVPSRSLGKTVLRSHLVPETVDADATKSQEADVSSKTRKSGDVDSNKKFDNNETGLAKEKENEDGQGALHSPGDKTNSGQFKILNVESKKKGIKTQNSKKMTSCLVCEMDFPDRKALLEHRDAQHSVLAKTDAGTTERRYPCDHCTKYFKNFTRMFDHRRNHVEIYQCSYCNNKYTRAFKLKKHIAYQHEGVYKCKHCQDGFQTEAEFNNHVSEKKCGAKEKVKKRRISKRPTNCHVCEMDFPDREALLEHRDTQHSVLATTDAGTTERRYTCDHCPKSFNTFWRMVDHRREHVNKMECSYCNNIYTRKNALKKHIAYKHEGVYKCKDCQDGFLTEAQFNNHVAEKKCQGNMEFTIPNVECQEKQLKRQTICQICGTDFLERTALLKHRVTQHSVLATTDTGTTERRYPCDHCTKYFMTFWRMVEHRKNHTDVYQCRYCNNKYSRQKKLDKHIAYRHEGVYKCEHCQDGFQTEEQFNNHVAEKKCQNWQCNSCDKFYPTKIRLNAHIKYMHKKWIQCDICKKMVAERSIKTHKAFHLGVRAHLCNVCGKRFITANCLTAHEKIHLKQRRFQCSICQVQFDLLSQAKVHARIHTGEKTCVCEICGKAFHRVNCLKRHMAQHGSEKAHSCPVCGKSFNEKSSCRNHIKRCHPQMKPFSCFICKESFASKQELDAHTVVHIDSGTEVVVNDDPVLQVAIETIDNLAEEF